MQKRKNENPSIKIYIDTCVLQGAISRRNEEDTIFMNSIREKGWKVFTSIHTLMELLDVAKDRSFLMKSVINKWVDVSTFLQERKTKNLNRNDLDEISEELNNFFRDNRFIEFHGINEDVWDDVKGITEKSNLHSSDALHLALARAWQCQALVTHDTFFVAEGNKLLKEANQYDNLRLCTPENVEETVEDVVSK
jgi:predicted nucleic acid-binding protein